MLKREGGELGPPFALYHNLAPSANQLNEQWIQLKGTVLNASSTEHNANQSKTRLKHSPVAARGKQRQTFRRRHCRRREAAPKRSLNEGAPAHQPTRNRFSQGASRPTPNQSTHPKMCYPSPACQPGLTRPWARGPAIFFRLKIRASWRKLVICFENMIRSF